MSFIKLYQLFRFFDKSLFPYFYHFFHANLSFSSIFGSFNIFFFMTIFSQNFFPHYIFSLSHSLQLSYFISPQISVKPTKLFPLQISYSLCSRNLLFSFHTFYPPVINSQNTFLKNLHLDENKQNSKTFTFFPFISIQVVLIMIFKQMCLQRPSGIDIEREVII